MRSWSYSYCILSMNMIWFVYLASSQVCSSVKAHFRPVDIRPQSASGLRSLLLGVEVEHRCVLVSCSTTNTYLWGTVNTNSKAFSFSDMFSFRCEYPPWNQHGTWKWMVVILLSYWGGLFSGAMLVSGRVPSSFTEHWELGGNPAEAVEQHSDYRQQADMGNRDKQ